MKKQGTGSVFKRLGLLFAAVVVVIYVVISFLFVQYVNEQKQVEMAMQQSRVINSASVMEQQIQAVYNMELQLTQDSRLTQLAYGVYQNNYERSQLILELIANIQGGKSVNSIIEDVQIVCPSEGILLSASDGYSTLNEETDYLPYKSSTKYSRLVYDGTPELNISYPLMFSGDTDELPLYVIRIILSEEYLNTYLNTFRNPEQGAFWVLSPEDEAILLTHHAADSDEEQENGAKHMYKVSEEEIMYRWSTVCKEMDSPKFMSEEIICGGSEFLVVSQEITDYNLTLVTYQNTKALFGNTGYTLLNLAIILVLVGVLFWFVILWANRTVGKPLYAMVDAFEKVQDGDLKVRIYHEANDEFGYIYASFNDTVAQIEDHIAKIKEQGELLQTAELMQLQSQINPHFLYNSFFIIKFMAHNEDYEQIETFVTSLAKYYRFLNKETRQLISLASEVEHMENYIDIQQMRFGDKITVHKQELPESIKEFKVPKLILQPIIENAYGYGLSSLLADGILKISYRLEDNILFIDIEDNGNILTEEKIELMRERIYAEKGEALNHALANIQRRLSLAYGEPNGVWIALGEMGGLKVTLRMDTSVNLE